MKLKSNLYGVLIKDWTLLYIILCILLALLNLYLKLEATPVWFTGILESNHQMLLDFNYTNNEQSRLLQFYIPEFLVRVFGLSVINAYILQRFLFTAITFFCFYLYAKKWFKHYIAMACVLIMAMVIMPYTYVDDLQESSSLLGLTFLLAIWAIREGKTALYSLVLLIGALNNESMLFVPAVYLFVNFDSWKFSSILKLTGKTVLWALPAIIAVCIIRYITFNQPHLGGAWHFYENITHLKGLILVFNVFWVMAFLKFSKKPVFLQRALLTIPLFIIPHMITGIIRETRQMLPLSFIILPAAMFFLLELRNIWRRKKTNNQSLTPTS